MAAKKWDMVAAVVSHPVKIDPQTAAGGSVSPTVRRTEGVEKAEAILLRAQAIHPKSCHDPIQPCLVPERNLPHGAGERAPPEPRSILIRITRRRGTHESAGIERRVPFLKLLMLERGVSIGWQGEGRRRI
jgi:hypothetical protein